MNIALIGRFKPLHIGNMELLEYLCDNYQEVIIGIGSSNKYNAMNPFTVLETAEMLHRSLVLQGYTNFKLFDAPDFGNIDSTGQTWKRFLVEKLEGVTFFASGNVYVQQLLKDNFEIIDPAIVLNREIYIHATDIRKRIVLKEPWKDLVPNPVYNYIKENKLDKRLIEEFGESTFKNMSEEEKSRL